MSTEESRKTVSLKHIAQKAAVSLATVSMALSNHPHVSESTKARVRAAADEIGYIRKTRKPNRRSASAAGKPGRIGFLLLGSPVDEDIHLGFLHSLCTRASEAGARVDIQALEDVSDPARTAKLVQEFCRGINGLIISGMVSRHSLEVLGRIGIPYVVMGSTMDNFMTHGSGHGQTISYHVESMGELAVQWLLEKGHSRIGFVAERLPPGLWNDRWLRGYQLAHIKHKLDIVPSLIQITGQVRGTVQPAIDGFLKLGKPVTGFVVPDARIASLFLQGMEASGRKLDPSSIVISGYPSVVGRYQLGHLPWIGSVIDNLTSLAVRQIQQLCVQPLPCPTELILPFQTKNMGG